MSRANPEHITFEQLIIAARTVFAEARSEPDEGVLAVACVIWNRVRKRSWWGRALDTVCLKRWQFSCWNPRTAGQPEDRNYRAMVRATNQQLARYADAVLEAQRVAGTDADPSKGACHYLNPAVLPRLPKWARNREPDVVIGRHHFYVGVN